jgi:hypothetical protein
MSLFQAVAETETFPSVMMSRLAEGPTWWGMQGVFLLSKGGGA